MDLNVNVTVSAPDLVEALSLFAHTMATGKPVEIAPVVHIEKPKQTRKHAEKAAATQEPEEAKEDKKEATTAKEPEPERASDVEEDTAPETEDKAAITIEVVRGKLAAIARSGKAAQVNELIKSLGASKLTNVPEEKYPELLEKAEKL